MRGYCLGLEGLGITIANSGSRFRVLSPKFQGVHGVGLAGNFWAVARS